MDNDDLAMRYCERLTSIGYKSPDVYYVLIKSEFNLNRNPEKAFNISKKALSDFPGNINLLEQQTDMYVRMNRNKEALSNLFLLEEKKPQDVQVLINIATQYDKLKEHENSIQYYIKALSIDSTNYIANYNMAVYSIKQSKEIEKRIVSNDSLQVSSNKLYKVTDYTKDPLRVELKNKLDQANAYYSKAIINSRDASEKKNLELVLSESVRLKELYLKIPIAQSKK
ncbi:MAG: hypothetical protein H7259_06350 [Cytophagales bacterium]|nr:hypothetical protein [Cytophaga sp.]